MKKILLILGILAFVAPVVADDSVLAQSAEPATGLDVSELIKAKSDIEEGCTGDVFQVDTSETPLQMAAVYVDGCASGTYLNVANDASIGSDGTLSGVSCETCPTGNQCPGIDYDKIEITGGRLSSQGAFECEPGMYSDTTGSAECEPCAVGTYQDTKGQPSCKLADGGWYVKKEGSDIQIQCPVGYRDGTTTGGTSIYSCQKEITQEMCNAEKNNFNTGTMTIKSGLNLPFLVNYRDLDNHCFGSLECNAGYNKTAENSNAYKWLRGNPTKTTTGVYCPISGVIHSTQKSKEPCNNGQEPGTIKWTLEGENVPMASANFVAVCSDKTADTITSDSADYDDLTAESTGSTCYVRNVDFPNQPWLMLNDTSYKDIEECEAECGEEMANAYPLINKSEISSSQELLVVTDGNGNYYAEAQNQFYPVVMVPTDTCYNVLTGEQYDNIASPAACGGAGEHPGWSYGTARFIYNNAEPVTGEIVNKTYVLYDKMSQFLTDSAQLTTNDTNVNICTPNSITIAWGDVTLDANDPANTCTYGGALITPTSKPASDGSRLFLGWKPVASTPAPSQGE